MLTGKPEVSITEKVRELVFLFFNNTGSIYIYKTVYQKTGGSSLGRCRLLSLLSI